MQLIEIKDVHEPQLDIYARLSEGQLLHYYEPAGGLFIAESPMIIHRALDAGYSPLSMLVEHKLAEGQGRELIARCGDIPVYTAEREVLERITGYALTRGMLCAMRRRPLPDAAQVCQDARRIVVLENVMNPTNVGAIFRSAAALGMDGILLTPGSCDPLYRRAVRVGMGTVFRIPWTFLNLPGGCGDVPNRAGPSESNEGQNVWNAVEGYSRKGNCGERQNIPAVKTQGSSTVRFLRSLGFKTVAMALREDAVSLEDPRLQFQERLAVVLGTEGDGLAADTIADCDYTVRIPMAHGVDSLNVAAASAVAFWQLGRRGSAP